MAEARRRRAPMTQQGMGLQDLKGRVAQACYRVDAGAVAEAMLRRPSVHLLLGTRCALTSDDGARSRAAATRSRPAG
jgi:hypothetical protein